MRIPGIAPLALLRTRASSGQAKPRHADLEGVPYHVYVIELEGALAGTLYVGQTAHTPEQRLQNHLTGHRASRIVRQHGGHLRPDLYEHLGPYDDREHAEKVERILAEVLSSWGFVVYGGH